MRLFSRTTVKSFKNRTQETDFSSVSAIIRTLYTSSDNWLTVLPSTPQILFNLNFENDDIRNSINLEELKNEQKKVKLIYHAVVSDRKPLNSERTKFDKKKQKNNFKLLEQIKVKLKLNFS